MKDIEGNICRRPQMLIQGDKDLMGKSESTDVTLSVGGLRWAADVGWMRVPTSLRDTDQFHVGNNEIQTCLHEAHYFTSSV